MKHPADSSLGTATKGRFWASLNTKEWVGVKGTKLEVLDGDVSLSARTAVSNRIIKISANIERSRMKQSNSLVCEATCRGSPLSVTKRTRGA